jgi:hypothetical protein
MPAAVERPIIGQSGVETRLHPLRMAAPSRDWT